MDWLAFSHVHVDPDHWHTCIYTIAQSMFTLSQQLGSKYFDYADV